MSKRWIVYLVAALVLVAVLVAFRTVFNKRWWIARAVAHWRMKREEVDGVVWVNGPSDFFREDYLLQQPLRRLREFYDTGTMKEPAAVGGTIEQDAPDE